MDTNEKENTVLIKTIGEERYIKEVVVFDKPESLRPLLSPIGWKILHSLAEGPKYPAQIARELQLYRQKVYYYTRRLEKSGLIKPIKEDVVAGAIARYYVAVSSTFVLELPNLGEKIVRWKWTDKSLEQFWRQFMSEDRFTGKIVVGSPEPHGPLKTYARDGHYAVHLAFFLGQFFQTPLDFAVKLDVDVKTEKEEGGNLILIGGPGTNLLTAEINLHLPIHFDKKNYWAGIVDSKGNIYSGSSDGVIAKIRNPYDQSKSIVVLAGNRHVGTKSAIIAMTSYHKETLNGYKGEDTWARVIRGFDMDGDGKVDSVEILS
jgi:DNA-binding Lrp family transcriptional regulator